MLHSRTLLFIHSICNSLQLLIPNSQSIHPPSLLPLGNRKSVIYVCEPVVCQPVVCVCDLLSVSVSLLSVSVSLLTMSVSLLSLSVSLLSLSVSLLSL